MAKGVNISISIDRTTILSFGLSAAVHCLAIGGLATIVVQGTRSGDARSAATLLGLDRVPLPKHADRTESIPPPATQQDIERLLAKVPLERIKIEDPEEVRIRLGVDDGRVDTQNWVGFADATEHSAVKSPVEQSALSLQAGALGETGVPETAPQPASSPAPIEEEPSQLQEEEQQKAAEREAREGAGNTERGAGSDAADRIEKLRQEFQKRLDALPGVVVPPATERSDFADLQSPGASGTDGSDQESREAKERIEESKETKSGASAQDPVPPSNPNSQAGSAASSPTRPSVAPTPSGESKRPGIQDDREAEATSLTEPINITVNGKVAAAKGLKIRTVQPEFATTTRLTARPRSPQVLITFNKAGKVVRASFTPGRSTGYDDVDQPLLNSIYRWTARGETLAKLAAASPRAELTITVNVLFP